MIQLALLPSDADTTRPTAAEFFAGVGLVRLGLEEAGFRITWSNDIEKDKMDMYVQNFENRDGAHTYELGDIADVKGSHMADGLSLAWASFPCTDLSLAGARRGLAGSESGTFWHFVRVLEEMGDRRPPVIALENVVGFATSHGGEDLATAIRALNELDYSIDVLALDARRFVPQSRPRMFLVGAVNPPADEPIPANELRPDWLQGPFGDPSLRTHRALLPAPPPPMTTGLTELADRLPPNHELWWSDERRQAFVSSLSPIQFTRLEALRRSRVISRRTAYRRTRGGKPTWEIRPDDISGCLRTARGGSSKQAVVEAGKGLVRVRWMTPLEYAKLMGAADYRLDGVRTNQALFGFGDAVCVPAVSWLARNYLLPLVRGELQNDKFPRLAVAAGT